MALSSPVTITNSGFIDSRVVNHDVQQRRLHILPISILIRIAAHGVTSEAEVVSTANGSAPKAKSAECIVGRDIVEC